METKETLLLYHKIHDAILKKSHREVFPSEITKTVKNTVNDTDIIFKTVRDKAADNNMIIIGGMYDPNEDEEYCPAITISLHFNPLQKTVAVKDLNVPFVCREIISTILHEQCHCKQYRKRNFTEPVKNFKFQNESSEHTYLGTKDEIEAYGVTIASDIFMRSGFKIPDMLLHEINKTHEYQMYQKTFGTSHSITKSVKRYIETYIKEYNLLFK